MNKTRKISAILLTVAMLICGVFATNVFAEDPPVLVFDSASNIFYMITDGEAAALDIDTDRVNGSEFVFPATLGGCPLTSIGPENDNLQLFSYTAEPITSITVPSTVKRIGDGAFSGTFISEIELPEALTYLGDGAFHGCLMLETVAIPDGVENINDMTFKSCEKLADVTLPANLKSIGFLAFGYTSVKDITISEDVESIGEMAFFYCPEMTKITVLSKTVEIGEMAIGYTVEDGEEAVREDFTIYGYKNSTAEAYANENGIKFVDLEAAEEPTPDPEPEQTSAIVDVINKFVSFITMIISYIVEFFNSLKK